MDDLWFAICKHKSSRQPEVADQQKAVNLQTAQAFVCCQLPKTHQNHNCLDNLFTYVSIFQVYFSFFPSLVIYSWITRTLNVYQDCTSWHHQSHLYCFLCQSLSLHQADVKDSLRQKPAVTAICERRKWGSRRKMLIRKENFICKSSGGDLCRLTLGL